MEFLVNRNGFSGKFAPFTAALIILAGFQPGFSGAQEVSEIRMSAEKGDAEAQFKLGVMYDNGEGMP